MNSLPMRRLLRILDNWVPTNTEMLRIYQWSKITFLKTLYNEKTKNEIILFFPKWNLSDHYIPGTSIKWITLTFSTQITKTAHLFYTM